MLVSPYLYPVLTGKRIEKCCEFLKQQLEPYASQFETIAFCGNSGCLVAPMLSLMMDKKLTMVRKDGENRHSGCSVEGEIDYNIRYIIVDDQIDKGDTLRFISSKINMEISSMKCVGVALYYQTPLDYKIFKIKEIFHDAFVVGGSDWMRSVE